MALLSLLWSGSGYGKPKGSLVDVAVEVMDAVAIEPEFKHLPDESTPLQSEGAATTISLILSMLFFI